MPSNSKIVSKREPEVDATYDAVIVGAGFAGMYMLHRLHGPIGAGL